MAVGKEILTKIRTTQSTQKITKAMQMVSTSKMRKTQERMRKARPYAEKVRVVMGHLARSNDTDTQIPLLQRRDTVRRVGLILITSDKGLAGGLNSNALKRFFNKVHELREQNIEVEVVCLGAKGLAACTRVGLNVVASAVALGDTPKFEKLLGPLQVIFDRYALADIDAIHLVYTGFINTMRQEPRIEQLLPISDEVLEAPQQKHGWDYVYEPDPATVLDFLIRRYLESVVYHAISENMASEQAARMVAMKAATDNAGNVIKELRLIYNKSRQAAITTELSEIVAGAAAV